MPLTQIQAVDVTTDNASNIVANFTQTTENNLLVFRFVADVLISTPTGWTRDAAHAYQGGNADVGIMYRLAPSGTYTTQTFTGNSGDKVSRFTEHSGNETTGVLDGKAAGATSGYSTGTTGTTVQADELALAVAGASGSNTTAPNSPTNSFTLESSFASGAGTGTEVGGGFASRALSAIGTYSTTFSGPGGNASGGMIATFKAAAAGITEPVNQVTETDTAQPIAKTKAKDAGQVTETDIAQPIVEASEIIQPVNQVTETDIAQPIAKVKARGTGQVTETDIAQPIGTAKVSDLAQVVETNVAQPISTAKALELGQVVETSVTQPISPTFGFVVGQVAEADLVQAIGEAKAKTLGQVTEADLVQPVLTLKLRDIGQVVEADLAQQIGITFGHIIGQVDELDIAQQISEAITLSQVLETDIARPITVIIGVIPGPPEGPRTLVAVESGHTLVAIEPGHTLVAVE